MVARTNLKCYVIRTLVILLNNELKELYDNKSTKSVATSLHLLRNWKNHENLNLVLNFWNLWKVAVVCSRNWRPALAI